jgi:predicted membrane channel-forming protein YqfA (hemolysin III family)
MHVTYISGLFYLIGVIFYGAKFVEDFIKPADSDPEWGEYKLSYCYGLSVAALVFELIAGILVFLAANTPNNPGHCEEQKTCNAYKL